MTTKMKNYTFGKMTFKAYCKPAGKGFECGITFQGKPVFVGNFIHKSEATKWWGLMSTYCAKFVNTHEFVPTAGYNWYCKYFANTLYKNYYMFLDKEFTKYQKTYSKNTVHFAKHYKKMEARFYAA